LWGVGRGGWEIDDDSDLPHPTPYSPHPLR
jgi:hypothetical protein